MSNIGKRNIMSKKDTEHTLWTKPKSDWTPVLEAEFSAEIKATITNAISSIGNEDKFKDRLKPYNTPITNDTLSRSVK